MSKKLKTFTTLLINIAQLMWSFEIFAFADVSTATDTIIIKKGTKLYLPSEFESKCLKESYKNSDIYCFPKSNLYLINKSKKYDLSALIAQWNNHDFVHFIKITSNKYFDDLNHDGHPEVAIFPMVAGNSPIGSAIIYTFKDNNLTHYGLGDFYWENGKHVINIKKGKIWH